MQFNIQPFNALGIKGLNIYGISLTTDVGNRVNTVLDLSTYIRNGTIKYVSAIQVQSQFGTVAIESRSTGITQYYPVNSQTMLPANDEAGVFDITYYGSLATTYALNIIVYEQPQDSFSLGLYLP